MEFILNLLLSIAVFFGLAQEPNMMAVEPEVVAVIEESSTEIDTEQSKAIEGEDIKSSSSNGIASASDMSGLAKPVLEKPETSRAPDMQSMLVAGGCFWCVESDLEKLPGVISVVSGYAGGSTENPTYENYGKGGHREVVEVIYDAKQISFEDILIVTMKTTDPTDDDGTFYDRGDKYSAAFYHETEGQKNIIENLIKEVDEYGPYKEPLAIDVEKRPRFWSAEDYHQDYYKGTLSQVKYKYYRNASGRDDFIEQYWSDPHSPDLPWRDNQVQALETKNFWNMYQKPDKTELKDQLSELAFKVTQEDGTERAGTSPLDKVYEPGIYVDILSGEPLFSSADKFDSGTGWPSFVKPITAEAVTEHEDRKLFVTRTEVRSAVADNHLGHVFTDGPADRGGLRYCMNGVALRFVPKDQMEAEGYGEFLGQV